MQQYKLENELLEIGITSVGAEICRIKSKKTGIEYMWQGNPEIWGSQAPVLFPIVGGLKNDTYYVNQQPYHMPRHGFVRRNNRITLAEEKPHKITLELQSDESTWLLYPFYFSFFISFELSGNQLTVSHLVTNPDDRSMYFSLGGHPAFNCPVHPSQSYSDYFLRFEKEENLRTWNLNKSGQIAAEGEYVLKNSKILPLRDDMFEHDALIFKSLKSRSVSLCDASGERIRVRFPEFKSLGLWAKPKAPFICIEPWLGYADAAGTNQHFMEKEGIIKLCGNDSFSASYSIEIVE